MLIGLTPYIKEPPIAYKVEEKTLDDYVKLCLDNNAKPIVVVLPVNAAIKKTYNADVLKLFWEWEIC